jgi:hypothetical protein
MRLYSDREIAEQRRHQETKGDATTSRAKIIRALEAFEEATISEKYQRKSVAYEAAAYTGKRRI